MVTYHPPPALRLIYFGLACVFGLLSIVGLLVPGFQPLALVCLAPITLSLVIIFVSTDYRIEADEHEVRVHRFGRTSRIRWDEISRVSSPSVLSDLELHNPDQTVVVRLSAQGQWYPELIEWLRHKRPDLWQVTLPAIFPASLIVWLLYAGGSVFMVGITLLGFLEQQRLAVLGLLMSSLAISVLATELKTVILERDELRVRSLVHEHRIRKENIEAIGLSQHTHQGLTKYVAFVKLSDGKTISLDGLKVNGPMLYNILRTWWQPNEGFTI